MLSFGIFPDVPINAGTFEPLEIIEPEGTFLYARYPRPVSGCAAEVSQRIAEAVFVALARAIPDRLFAAPAGNPRLLVVFMRGAYYAANFLVPYGSSFYYESRPNIAVPRPGSKLPRLRAAPNWRRSRNAV